MARHRASQVTKQFWEPHWTVMDKSNFGITIETINLITTFFQKRSYI
jgi:hypothetical protein